MTVSANKGRHASSHKGLSLVCQTFSSRTKMRGRSVSKLNSFGRCQHELMASFIMLTSCHWRRRSAPRCVRRRVLPHGSDSLSAVASVPMHLRSTRRARNRWIHACGVEPSLHRDRLISGSKPHRNPAFQQRERAQNASRGTSSPAACLRSNRRARNR